MLQRWTGPLLGRTSTFICGVSVVAIAGVLGQIHTSIPEFLDRLIFNEVIMNPNVNLKFATLLLLIKMIDVKMDSDG